MTTIAYDGRYIAVDSRCSGGSYIYSDSADKVRQRNGWVLFIAGDVCDIDEFVNRFFDGTQNKSETNVKAIGFEENTSDVYAIFWLNRRATKSKITYMDSLGSGEKHAITAMDCGLNAVDAIKVTMKRNTATGGAVRCFDTKTGKFIKVKQ